MNSKVNVIIHGHFYQPPREDPWTEEIDNQPSAYPHKNWNFRVHAECYRPNAFSRVLDHDGRIKAIINNYEYLSFNIGPTLMQWIEGNDSEVYNKIIEADKTSQIRCGGHGNAIAQIYNHVIMPLQSFEDKKTEIIWGLKDFEHRFNRQSEGIWLSETAVDYKTIDLLIEEKIKFIILSPLQALSFRECGSEEWINCDNPKFDPAQIYKIIRPHGEISVFFYNKELSSAVSFEHLLRNADNFASKILNNPISAKDNYPIIIATDGEIYGHHEPFGDMCISSLINNYCINDKRIKFTNFGEILEHSQPQYEIALWLGEDNLGSSWSCHHGVGRWYRDCGCHTSGSHGWNQKWRTPLREAFDLIKNELDIIYKSKLSEMINEPAALRNAYITFLTNKETEYKNNFEFIDRFKTRELSKEEIDLIMRLLDAQKNALFMYTSCGWFFSELSGIETIQNIKYAVKVIYLIGELTDGLKNTFETKIYEAKSNIKHFYDGKWIANNWIYNHVQDLYHIAANFIALNRTGSTYDRNDFSLFHSFSYEDYSLREDPLNGYFEGEISVKNNNSHSSRKLSFQTRGNADGTICIKITDFENKNLLNSTENNMSVMTLTEKDLLNEVKQFIVDTNVREKIIELSVCGENLMEKALDILNKYRNIDISTGSELNVFIKGIVEIFLYKTGSVLLDFPDETFYGKMDKLFDYLKFFNIKPEAVLMKNRLCAILNSKLSGKIEPFSQVITDSINLVTHTNEWNLIFEKSSIENKVFNILKNELPEMVKNLETSSEEDQVKIIMQIRKIIRLSEIFNINTDDEKKMVVDKF